MTTTQQESFLLAGKRSIHRMGFGAMRLTGENIWGEPKDRKEAHAILKRALNLGVNFIDTADSYGPEVSENILAEALYPYPKDLVIATKGGLVRPGPQSWVPVGRPEYLMQCIEMSLRRLKLDCIELYQLHAVDPHVPLEDSVGTLKEMQRKGKIRFIGLSNVSVSEIQRAQKIADIASIQNRYNLFDRKSEDVLNYCEKQKMAFIPWYPIGGGDLSPFKKLDNIQKGTPAQIALAWLLQHSNVMIPIPGTASLSHLEENMAAASLKLDPRTLESLSSANK